MKDQDDSAEEKKQGDESKAAFESLRKEMAEREKAEAALRQSERDFRHLFENAHDAIIIFRPEDEIILEVNKRACDLYGFDRSEFIGMSLEKISKNILHGRKHIKITLDKGDFHHLESVHYRKDGTEMAVEINSSVVNYQGQWAIQSINRDITKRKRAEEAREQSELKFRKLVEQSLQGLVIAQGLPPRLVFANLAFADMLGYTVEELLSLPPEGIQGLVHPEDRVLFFSNYQDRLKGNPVTSRYEIRTQCKDGSVRWLEILSSRIDYSGQPAVQAAFMDVTARKEAEGELRRLNRTLKMITACDRAVVQATKEADFLYEICLLAVEVGGYRLAWVGFAEEDPERTVRPVAQAGYVGGYLESVKISWKEGSEWGRGPIGTAIRTRKPVVCRNIPTDPAYAPWREEATKRGFASSIALPLVVGGRTLGALNIYAAETDAFDTEEVTLLTELADDLAYGIHVLRTRAASQRMEEMLRDSEEKYRLLVDNSQQGILVLQDGKIQFANPRTVQHSGYSLAELTSRPFLELIHPEDRAMVSERYEKRLKVKELFDIYQFRFLDKLGRVQWVESNSVQVGWKGRPASLSFLSDITERKQAEEALGESEERYRIVVENLGEGIGIADLEERFTFVNPAAEAIFGVPPGKLVGRTLQEFTTPEQYEEVLKQTGKRKIGERSSYELEIVRPGGERRNLLVTACPRNDHQGRFIGSFGIFRDITDRIQALNALRESEIKYRGLVDQSRQGIMIAQGVPPRIVFANPSMSEILGYSLEELTSMPPEEMRKLVHPDDLAVFFQRYQERLEGGNPPPRYEVRAVRKDGTIRWTELVSSQIEYRGQPAVQAAFQDITERRQTEEALKDSEAKYRTLMVGMSEAVVQVDNDDLIQFVNPQFCQMIGYREDELLGRVGYEIYFGPEEQEMLLRKNLLRLEKATDAYETRMRNKNGEEVLVRISGSPVIDSRGEVVGSIGVITDITERKRLEENVLQLQKMEAIGRLSGGVAHDFNNMLQSITGYVDMALQKLPGEDPSRKYLEGIEKTVEKAASLTYQLLAFSRKQVFQPVVIDVNEIVRDCEKMLRRLIGEDIEIVTRLDPEAGRVKVDPVQIEQVIMNLVVNARDAMPQGGRLTLETAPVDLGSVFIRSHPDLFQGPHVMLTIADTGCGMDAETLAHIFEPFFTTKEKGKGTGLGLATVYGIVRQSEGGIEVQSTPGRGTTFKVYLPREGQEMNATNAVATPPELSGGTETVLLAEDDGALRGMIRDNLSQAGYTVLEAENGKAALRVFTQHPEPVHLLIADVVMPKMSGPDLARHLAAQHPELKVIFISGYPNDATFSRGLKPLGLAFLQKPFKPHVLLRKVREVLDTQ